MNLELILRMIAIVAAVLLVLSNINVQYLYEFVSSKLQRKTDNFIDIINAWHILREKCESANLTEAVVKLDETFPLLNQEADNV